MTQNQIAYWTLQETKRANQAREAETNRSNLAQEYLTGRRDAETATWHRNTETETHRHNYADETEKNRHNLIDEAETYRHNYRNENASFANALARAGAAKSDSLLGKMSNLLVGSAVGSSVGAAVKDYSIPGQLKLPSASESVAKSAAGTWESIANAISKSPLAIIPQWLLDEAKSRAPYGSNSNSQIYK